jgi:death-on-curing protein
MRYLTLNEVLELHRELVRKFGGSRVIRDMGALESAIAQPRMTFGGKELYPTIVEKAVALGYSIVKNHPFVDGNKRAGHAAVEVFLVLNGHEIKASTDEQEQVILRIASGELSREEFKGWLKLHLVEK